MEENIVKQVCKELNINQATLAKRFGVSTSTVSEWNKGKIPKMTHLALNLLLENKKQKEQLKKIKEAFSLIQKIE